MKRKSALFLLVGIFFLRRYDYRIIQFHESMPRNDAFVGVVIVTFNLELPRQKSWSEVSMPDASWSGMLIEFVGCLMTSRTIFNFHVRRWNCQLNFQKQKANQLSAFIFSASRKKRCSRERNKDGDGRRNCMWYGEMTKTLVFTITRKKKFLFVIFTTMHSTSQFLLALSDDSLRKKTHNGWHLWNVFEHFKLFFSLDQLFW